MDGSNVGFLDKGDKEAEVLLQVAALKEYYLVLCKGEV